MATIFQDNFEHNDIGVYLGESETNGTIDISSDQAHSGTYSLKSNITTNDGVATVNLFRWSAGGINDYECLLK